MPELDYEIESVGGIEHARLTLKPGVNVLKGRNAAGKTSAMRALTRAHGGAVPLERQDGADVGVVKGPGIELRVGNVIRQTGEVELSLADVGPLGRLIDPGLKGSEAAARERVRALAELVRPPVDDDAMRALCPIPDLCELAQRGVRTDSITDILGAAEKIRGILHQQAREMEEIGTKATAAAEIHAAKTLELKAEAGGEEALKQACDVTMAEVAYIEAVKAHERAIIEWEARQSLEQQKAEIREAFMPAEDVDALRRELQGLERDIDRQSEILRTLIAHRATVQMKMEAAEKAADARRRQEAILEQPVSGADQAEVERQIALVYEAEATRTLARLADTYRLETNEHKHQAANADQATREAQELRKVAAAIPQRLGELLAKAGAQGVTVIDGRLHTVEVGGRVVDFEKRQSTGQRIAVALKIAAQVYGTDQVVPLDDTFWLHLDPSNRADFAAMAQAAGLYVVTEEPADGELRVEHVEANHGD